MSDLGLEIFDLEICPAAAVAEEEVTALLTRCYGTLLRDKYPAEVLAKAVPVIGKARPALLQSPTYFAARLGGRVVGLGGWTQDTPFGRAGVAGRGHIRHVACCPDHTRRGIATALIRQVFETGAAAGVVEFNCLSTLSAEPFYRAMGFHPVESVALRLSPEVEFPAVQMRWTKA